MDNNLNKTYLGVVSAHPKGFGFVTTADLEEFFISPSILRELVPGDTISFKIEAGKKPGAFQVANALIVLRPETVWQGTLRQAPTGLVLETDEPCFVKIQVQSLVFACAGGIVSVRIKAFSSGSAGGVRGGPVKGVLERILGERSRVGFDVDYALAKHDFEPCFRADTLRQCSSFTEDDLSRDPSSMKRADLISVPFVTIDGESTRDFDDAVFATKVGQGWRVLVAIADVSYYVKPGSPVDKEAQKRATSVYLPGQTVPMLPETLSNTLCSLIPGKNRMAVVAEITLDENAAVLSTTFSRAVIRSAQRLTYSDVNNWSQGNFTLNAEVEPSMNALWAVYQKLAALHKGRGHLDFDAPEVGISAKEDGTSQLNWSHRNDAHKLIEELMLLANQCAALRLQSTAGALFRHQPMPETEDWDKVTTWAKGRGFDLPATPSIPALVGLMGSLEPEEKLKAELQARRGMRPATYDDAKPAHFSLGFAAYTHFTSPIRRYADLVVHRLLLGECDYTAAELTYVAKHCSLRSRAASMAERDVWDKIKKRLMFRDVSTVADLKGHVVSQSRRGLRAVVSSWQTSVLISAEEMLEEGFVYDLAQDGWVQGSSLLEPGSALDLRLIRLDEDKAKTELHAELV